MRERSNFGRWRPVVGVLAVGLLVFGLSLQGSTVSTDVTPGKPGVQRAADTDVITLPKIMRQRRSPVRTPVKAGYIPDISLPRFAPQVVNVYDDEPSRLREAGELIGPMPNYPIGGVATGGCTFDIDCETENLCEAGSCEFPPGQPVGSGKCVYAWVPAGQPGDCGDTDDDPCNGVLVCDAAHACVAGPPVTCSSGQVCDPTTEDGDCIPECTSNPQCNPDLCYTGGTCNLGTGLCENVQETCGPGANCVATTCQGGVNNGQACVAASECPPYNPADPNHPCVEQTNPVCYLGRCCEGDAEPDCKKRRMADCDWAWWYSGDTGLFAEIASGACPEPCPKYSAGIANVPGGPAPVYTDTVGPISWSPRTQQPFGTVLYRLGDDYKLSNDPDQFIQLERMRFVGGMGVPERIAFEFYDASGNFIEDLFFISDTAIGVWSVLFDPPFTIPSQGFMVQRVAQSFAPNATIYWLTTASVDIGTNDPDVIWVNDDVHPTMGNADIGGYLAFELVGEKTTEPFGACCDAVYGTCEEEVAWTCRAGKCRGGSDDGNFCRDSGDCADAAPCLPDAFLGENTYCAFCVGGSDAGEHCRTCADDSPCHGDADCGGAPGSCAPNNSVCESNNCAPNPACTTGACCLDGGACEEGHDEVSCTGADEFQGYGTSCWPDCCERPVESYTGADDCDEAVVWVITVPGQEEAAKYITVTGDNSAATSTAENPDICFEEAESAEDDPGWWEAFSIDTCAYVRLDHCCTDPVHRPAYRVIYSECPCANAVFSRPNPHRPDDLDVARGLPYCPTDDNLWETYGPLPGPATYYYPIYSAPAGNHGVYQWHITVEACPRAICCVGSDCQFLNTLECEAAGGFYLGPPNTYDDTIPTLCVDPPEVCDPSNPITCGVCELGSCCTGPGQCEDVVTGPLPITQTECEDVLFGDYLGGIKCQGGYCQDDPIYSCAQTTDCATGICVGDELELNQPNPCPVCQIEGLTNCQSFADDLFLSGSDLASDLTAADDFIARGSTITTVCAWGVYFITDQEIEDADCGTWVTEDHFRVRIFENNAGVPGAVVGQSTAVSERAIIPNSQTFVIFDTPVETYGYQMVLDDPITGLVPDECYWIEIANDTSLTEDCLWFWHQLSADSSAANWHAATGFQDDWWPSPNDHAFCLDMDIGVSPGGCGDVIGACCACDGSCTSNMTLRNCNIAEGEWHMNLHCDDVTCQVGAPANDNCDELIEPVENHGNPYAGVVRIPTNTYCATTDGHNPIETDFGEDPMGAEVWFSITPSEDCPLIVSMCSIGSVYDSMMGLYKGPDGTGECPCPQDLETHLASFLLGADETCNGVADGGAGDFRLTDMDDPDGHAKANTCYVARIGGWGPGNDSVGSGVVDFSCITTQPLDPPTIQTQACADDNDCHDPETCDGGVCGIHNNRYLSIVPPVTGGEMGIMVEVADGPCAGATYHAGALADYPEKDPGQPLGWFTGAPLQDTAVYSDMSAAVDGNVHLFGAPIAPGTTYRVYMTSATGGLSDALQIRTAKWGDITRVIDCPTCPVQPDFGDIAAVVEKFQGQAYFKSQAQLQPKVPDPLKAVDFKDIGKDVDAFKGVPYPYVCTP